MRCGIYRHYKGGYYLVLGIAEHTETHETVVVYVSLTGIELPGPRMRVRPLCGPEGWTTQVEAHHPVRQGDVTLVDRFVYVGTQLK